MLTVDEARKLARQRLLEVKGSGRDPARERKAQREAPRFAALIDRYVEERVPTFKATTQRSEKNLLARHVRPRLDDRTVASLVREDIERIKSDLRATPGAANKVIGCVSRLAAFAEDLGWRARGTNPTRGVKKNSEKKVERWLTAEERARLERTIAAAERAPARSLGHVDASACACFRLLAMTGMRLGEALDLRWRDVDTEHSSIVLATHKTDRQASTKIVRLSSAAVRFLDALPRDRELVFCSEHGRRLDNMQRRWITIRKAASLPDLRIHDLRHAWASDAAMLGVPLHVVGKQLGHASPTTTNRYAHLAGDVVAEAVEHVGAIIEARAQGKSKVVALRGGKRR